MINKLKLGVKLLKYSFNFKLNVISSAIFFTISIVWCFLPNLAQLTPMYLALIGLQIQQMLISLQFSDMVLSSPRKREIQISVAVAVGVLGSLFSYALTSVVIILGHKIGTWEEPQFGILILCGVLLLERMVYEVLWQKTSTAAGIVFVIMFFGPVLWFLSPGNQVLPDVSLGAALGIGLAEILLGAVLQYLTARLTYRLPVKNNPMLQAILKYK